MEHDFFVKKGTLTKEWTSSESGSFGRPRHTSPDAMLQRVTVAIKIFRQNVDVEAVRRMLLETKILTMFINHNNVIKLLGFCTENVHKGDEMKVYNYFDTKNAQFWKKIHKAISKSRKNDSHPRIL